MEQKNVSRNGISIPKRRFPAVPLLFLTVCPITQAARASLQSETPGRTADLFAICPFHLPDTLCMACAVDSSRSSSLERCDRSTTVHSTIIHHSRDFVNAFFSFFRKVFEPFSLSATGLRRNSQSDRHSACPQVSKHRKACESLDSETHL